MLAVRKPQRSASRLQFSSTSSIQHPTSSIQHPAPHTMHIIDDETRRFGRLLHYAGLLLTALCAMLGYSLLHAPTRHDIADTMVRIEEVLLSVQNAPIIHEHHRKVSETLSDVSTRIAEVQRRVPQDADAGAFLKEVTQIANAEQLAIKDFQPGTPSSQKGYAEMQVTLNGQGGFASICTFLERLDKLQRLSKVQDLTLSATDDATDYPMSATLIIYFSLQGADAKPVQEDRRG
jgi:Tfp pilus assembly protein PilO